MDRLESLPFRVSLRWQECVTVNFSISSSVTVCIILSPINSIRTLTAVRYPLIDPFESNGFFLINSSKYSDMSLWLPTFRAMIFFWKYFSAITDPISLASALSLVFNDHQLHSTASEILSGQSFYIRDGRLAGYSAHFWFKFYACDRESFVASRIYRR